MRRRAAVTIAALSTLALLAACATPPADSIRLSPEDLALESCGPPDEIAVDELLESLSAPVICDRAGWVVEFDDGTTLEVPPIAGSTALEEGGEDYGIANLGRHGLVLTVESDGIREWFGHPSAVELWRGTYDRIDP